MWPEAGRIGRLTRRRLLCSVPLSLAAARGAFASGQQLQTHLPPTIAPRAKGPLVFLDYDQAELDAAYDQALWAPNRAEVAKRNAQKNALAAARLGPPRLLAYGPTEIEKLHLYAAGRSGAPIHVWIHGGAPGAQGRHRLQRSWRRCSSMRALTSRRSISTTCSRRGET